MAGRIRCMVWIIDSLCGHSNKLTININGTDVQFTKGKACAFTSGFAAKIGDDEIFRIQTNNT